MTTLRTLSSILFLAIIVAAAVALLDFPASRVTEAGDTPGLLICGEWLQPGDAIPAGCDLAPATQSGTISAPPRRP